MRPITEEERSLVLEALPEATTVARRYRARYGQSRDWLGATQLALCMRVQTRPDWMTLDQWARDTAHFACRGLFHARKGPHRFEGLILSLNDRDHETLGGRESENLEFEEEEAAQALLAPLSERERLVLWRRYVAGEYGARIAASLGFSGSFINRVEKRALEKLREIHGQANQDGQHRDVPRGRPTLAHGVPGRRPRLRPVGTRL